MNLDRFPIRDSQLEHNLHCCDLDAANAEAARKEDEAFEKKWEAEINLSPPNENNPANLPETAPQKLSAGK